jgi:putative peptidoglycan lipid II flippase
MLWRVVPGAIGAGVYQVNVYIDMVIASLLPQGSISFLYYADRINQLPLGVVGIAAGTALLPMLTRRLRAGDLEGASSQQNRTLEFSLFLTLPAAVALVVIAEPIVVVLFQRGEFDAASAHATAGALAIYAIGLPAYVLVKGLTPGFFAREDTATPVKIAAICVAINLVLSLALIGSIKHLGIATATAVSAWFNVTSLTIILYRRGHFRADARLKSRVPRIVAASLVMAASLWAGKVALADFMMRGTTNGMIGLAVLIAGGGVVYGLAALISGAADKSDVRRVIPARP